MKGAEPAFVGAGRREIEKVPFRRLDLLRRRALEIVAIGVVDDILADGDELAAQIEVVNGAAIVLGIENGDDRGGQAHEILCAADLGERAVLIEQILERHRIGDLAALDEARDGGEDAAVNGLGEMFGQQKFGDSVEGRIVDENGAQERLLGLDIARRRTVGLIAVAQRRDLRCGAFHDATGGFWQECRHTKRIRVIAPRPWRGTVNSVHRLWNA